MAKNPYYTTQIMTYMGNKRKFIKPLEIIIKNIQKKLNKEDLIIGEGFSGSGILSRLFKNLSDTFYVNDIAGYAKTLNTCYLSNLTNSQQKTLKTLIQKANDYVDYTEEDYPRFISLHWSPKGKKIKKSDRVYFTNENALRIDKYMHFIKTKIEPFYEPYLLAPLLIESSIHNNTNGQFSAFYKDEQGKGKYGGKKEVDIDRIKGQIRLKMPCLSDHRSSVYISQMDANVWAEQNPECDIMYYDPPYNKHPYCIYYFLLDIINNWDIEQEIPDTNRGQPKNWKKSLYNSFKHAEKTFRDLIKKTRAKYIILSYNNGGIIPLETLDTILQEYGKVEKIPIDYKVYNKLKGIAAYKREKKDVKIKEFLWILEKE